MRRRKFLYSTAMALATTALPNLEVNEAWALNALSLPSEPKDPFRSLILADVETRRLRDNPAQAQSVLAFPSIHTHIQLSGVAPTEAEIKRMLEKGGVFVS